PPDEGEPPALWPPLLEPPLCIEKPPLATWAPPAALEVPPVTSVEGAEGSALQQSRNALQRPTGKLLSRRRRRRGRVMEAPWSLLSTANGPSTGRFCAQPPF